MRLDRAGAEVLGLPTMHKRAVDACCLLQTCRLFCCQLMAFYNSFQALCLAVQAVFARRNHEPAPGCWQICPTGRAHSAVYSRFIRSLLPDRWGYYIAAERSTIHPPAQAQPPLHAGRVFSHVQGWHAHDPFSGPATRAAMRIRGARQAWGQILSRSGTHLGTPLLPRNGSPARNLDCLRLTCRYR